MAYYRISVILTNKPPVIGIKEHSSLMIEVVFNYFRNKAYAHFGQSYIKEFDCVMISKQSENYKKWMEKRKKKAGINTDNFTLDAEDMTTSASRPTRKKPPENNWGREASKGRS